MLVHFNEDDKGEDAKIRLYPSLQFGWDIPQFKTVADEALHAGEEDEQEEDGTDTEEEDRTRRKIHGHFKTGAVGELVCV